MIMVRSDRCPLGWWCKGRICDDSRTVGLEVTLGDGFGLCLLYLYQIVILSVTKSLFFSRF